MVKLEKINPSSYALQQGSLDNHQAVYRFEVQLDDKPSVGFIGVHDTTLGPALGGFRIRGNYRSEDEALDDVLRLSRGMTYKAAAAGLELGGGKAVLMADPRLAKADDSFPEQFGEIINRVGNYITAEDGGTDIDLLSRIAQYTDLVVGTSGEHSSQDPSPVTALGVLLGIKEGVVVAYGTRNLNGRSVAVQGAGNVGGYLIKMLVNEGVQVYFSELDDQRAAGVEDNATRVGVDDIYDLDVDVFSPTAFGGSVNPTTISRLRARIIAGAANNQLRDPQRDIELIREKGIIWVPDYVINAGGLINVYVELEEGGYDKTKAMERVRTTIPSNVKTVLTNKDLSLAAAEALGNQRLEEARQQGIPRRTYFLQGDIPMNWDGRTLERRVA